MKMKIFSSFSKLSFTENIFIVLITFNVVGKAFKLYNNNYIMRLVLKYFQALWKEKGDVIYKIVVLTKEGEKEVIRNKKKVFTIYGNHKLGFINSL